MVVHVYQVMTVTLIHVSVLNSTLENIVKLVCFYFIILMIHSYQRIIYEYQAVNIREQKEVQAKVLI